MALPSSDDTRWHRQPSAPGAVLSSAVQPLTPLMRSGRFVARSLLKPRDQTSDELPIARPTIALAGQALRDEIVLMGLKARRPVSQPRAFKRIDREVAAALEFYGAKGWLEKPKGFFAAPPPLSDVTVRQVKGGKPTFQRIDFDSGYAPRRGEPGRERWLGYTANHRSRPAGTARRGDAHCGTAVQPAARGRLAHHVAAD